MMAKQGSEDENDEDAEIEDVEANESLDPFESIVAFKNLLIKVLTENELD